MSKLLRFWRWPVHFQIVLGLVAGAGLGLVLGMRGVAALPGDVAPAKAGSFAAGLVTSSWAFIGLRLVGDSINGLKLIIVPLVMTSIILAIANMGKSEGFGRLGLKTLVYYMATSLIAILVGLLLVDVFHPGWMPRAKASSKGKISPAFAEAQSSVSARADQQLGG